MSEINPIRVLQLATFCEIIRWLRLSFRSGEIMDQANDIIVCIMFGAWTWKIGSTSLNLKLQNTVMGWTAWGFLCPSLVWRCLVSMNWLLNPSACFDQTFSIPDTFQVQIIQKWQNKGQLENKGRIQVFPRWFRAIFEFSYWSGSRHSHNQETMWICTRPWTFFLVD